MSRPQSIALGLAALVAFGVAALAHVTRAEVDQAGGPALGHPLGHAFSEADRAKIKKIALAHVAAPKGHTVRFLSVGSHALREGKDVPENPQKHVAEALLFNYTTGKATRLQLDPQTGKVIKQEEVTHFISSSAEERADGEQIIQADPKLFKKGDLIVGGFLINPPKGLPATKVPHRYLEYHVTGPDHAHKHEVIVDVSAKRVVRSKGLK
jgi:hypothetical protein